MLRALGLAALLAALAAPALAQDDELRLRIDSLADQDPPIPEGTRVSLQYMLDVAARIERRHRQPAADWRRRAERFLASAEEGRDPFPHGAGQILNRGYQPSYTPTRQGYAIYLPEDYDPERAYPLMVILHGGSSIGNLFLGVVLGNNLDWETYAAHLYDDFTPRYHPDWIVVAPDGVGQVIYRWQGEQDVLEVIDDVGRNYRVDPDRIALGGVSNGGMGTYAIGTRHAWRFSHVHAMAGAPSWLQYTGGSPTRAEEIAMLRLSGLHLIENSTNTTFTYFHGTRDTGPMRPAYVRELTAHMESLGLEAPETWFELGHDIMYRVHRRGALFEDLADVRRDGRPSEVRLVTGDYRANRQHWLTVTRIDRYPELARAHARIEAERLTIEADNVRALSVDLRDAPFAVDEVVIEVDEATVYSGPRRELGHVVHLRRVEEVWTLGFPPDPGEQLEKRPGLAGPMSDAYHDEIVHVYGTQVAAHERTLRRAAEAGARGWPLGLWFLGQRVIKDTEVTPELMARAHLALYGSPGDNAVLERIADRLPIRVEGDAVALGPQRFRGRDLGVRYVYPNPEAPDRYVLVHAGVTPQAVERTRNLPDFLPDYVVYDGRTVSRRPRLIAGRQHQLAAGYFDRHWALPANVFEGATTSDGGGELPPGVTAAEMSALAVAVGAPPNFILPPAVLQQTPPSTLAPGPAPDEPPRPRRFLAPADDPNGPIAREIARAVPTFYNYRAIIPGGRWRTTRRARFQIRPQADCLAALDEAEVPYRRITEDLRTPIPTPVELSGPIGGVTFEAIERDAASAAHEGDEESVRESPRVIVSCELAARLPVLVRALRPHRVRRVLVLSSHRTAPRQSFHRMGMALDILSFDTPRARLSVNDHFVETPSAATCSAPEPEGAEAKALLAIACALARSGQFQSVLTPNYNDGHRNHFHIDIRPNDPRLFVR